MRCEDAQPWLSALVDGEPGRTEITRIERLLAREVLLESAPTQSPGEIVAALTFEIASPCAPGRSF